MLDNSPEGGHGCLASLPGKCVLDFVSNFLILSFFSGLLLVRSEGRQEAEVVRLPQLVVVEVGDDDFAAVVIAVTFLAVGGCLLWFVALQHLLSSAPCL